MDRESIVSVLRRAQLVGQSGYKYESLSDEGVDALVEAVTFIGNYVLTKENATEEELEGLLIGIGFAFGALCDYQRVLTSSYTEDKIRNIVKNVAMGGS